MYVLSVNIFHMIILSQRDSSSHAGIARPSMKNISESNKFGIANDLVVEINERINVIKSVHLLRGLVVTTSHCFRNRLEFVARI